jgi:hypothetical protein
MPSSFFVAHIIQFDSKIAPFFSASKMGFDGRIRILSQFTWNNKVSVKLPVQPYNDLFEKMSDNQILNFKTKLQSFKTFLEDASNDTLISTACARLVKVFGGDFPTS